MSNYQACIHFNANSQGWFVLATKRHKGHKKRTSCRELKGALSSRVHSIFLISIQARSWWFARLDTRYDCFFLCLLCLFVAKIRYCHKKPQRTQKEDPSWRDERCFVFADSQLFSIMIQTQFQDLHFWIHDRTVFILCLLCLFVAEIGALFLYLA